MARRVISWQLAPPPMRHRHERALRARDEHHFHFSGLISRKRTVAPAECDARWRLPHVHLTHFEDAFALVGIDRFEDPAPDARLQPNESTAASGLTECRS